MVSFLQKTVRSLGNWRKSVVTKQKLGDEEIPHPATAPISTDQEAGGASTTPDGVRLYDERAEKKNE